MVLPFPENGTDKQIIIITYNEIIAKIMIRFYWNSQIKNIKFYLFYRRFEDIFL